MNLWPPAWSALHRAPLQRSSLGGTVIPAAVIVSFVWSRMQALLNRDIARPSFKTAYVFRVVEAEDEFADPGRCVEHARLAPLSFTIIKP